MDKDELLKQAKDRFSFMQRNKIEKAIDFASVKHNGQLRASGEPYITHPLSVASILIDWQVDLDSVIAAILHDTLEDTDTTLQEIEDNFGKDIAFLIDGVTKVSAARKGMREIKSYLPKTRDNLSKFLIAIGKDSRVLVIKLADRLHNLRTLKYLSPEKQHKIADESLEVFARLADRLGMGRVRVEIEEISFSYLEPKRYSYLKKLTKKRVAKAYARLYKVKDEVSDILKEQKIKHQIDGRIKSIYSLHRKLTKYDEDINEVYDLMAIRVIVGSKSSCYKTLGIIHNLYQPIIHKIKDYIATPKTNGYQSLHTTVKTSDDQIIEFQIRTKQMHDFAENGMAASFHYNEQKQSKNYFKRRSVSALPEHLDWTSQLKQTAKLVQEGTPIEDIKVDLFGDRIFIYSPDGDIYDLPEGSFPLDFAYAVHSDIGDSSKTFIVNGKIARFDHQLNSGDVVEVKTSQSNHPKSDWLKYVKTAKARNKIKTKLKTKSV
ncbi:bifunctional (p)ppGpp synthetase/guanosine-3',5'-bis(diphosphate) 3'-pyrophosphohydrolase [Candidatus Nomurabacteria bacterium]|nr:bifunctional (p)ppGpp synthetase/guanosine-3',5'-bis(diphosphate) 3'-pyrophosphohydrolase [Candidatus Nomurabacteria bacterium]